MRKALEGKEGEVAKLRAKLYLDMVDVNIKLVPEYPDLWEESEGMRKELEEKETKLKLFKEVKE